MVSGCFMILGCLWDLGFWWWFGFTVLWRFGACGDLGLVIWACFGVHLGVFGVVGVI